MKTLLCHLKWELIHFIHAKTNLCFCTFLPWLLSASSPMKKRPKKGSRRKKRCFLIVQSLAFIQQKLAMKLCCLNHWLFFNPCIPLEGNAEPPVSTCGVQPCRCLSQPGACHQTNIKPHHLPSASTDV